MCCPLVHLGLVRLTARGSSPLALAPWPALIPCSLPSPAPARPPPSAVEAQWKQLIPRTAWALQSSAAQQPTGSAWSGEPVRVSLHFPWNPCETGESSSFACKGHQPTPIPRKQRRHGGKHEPCPVATFVRPGCFIRDHFTLTRCILSKGHLCGIPDHGGTVRGDPAQESESTSNTRVFGCEVLIVLFGDRENSPCTPLH